MTKTKAIRKAKSPRRTRAIRAVTAAALAPPPAIELGARTTIAQAAVLHRALSEHIARAQTIVIDGSRVEEIDTAILQLLANLWRCCMLRGIACSWAGASDKLRRTAALIGVADMLRFPSLVVVDARAELAVNAATRAHNGTA